MSWPLSDWSCLLFIVILDTWKAVVQIYTKKLETLTTSLFCFWSKQSKDSVAKMTGMREFNMISKEKSFPFFSDF